MLSLHTKFFWDGSDAHAGEGAFALLERTNEHLLWWFVAPHGAEPPPSHPVGPTPGLWNHEVVELFVKGPGPAYTELEAAASGHYLPLRLKDVRQPTREAWPLRFDAAILGDWWTGLMRVPLDDLPPPPWTGNLYRIHGAPRRHLCAFPVPAAAPDFHQPHHFGPLPDARLQPASPGERLAWASGLDAPGLDLSALESAWAGFTEAP